MEYRILPHGGEKISVIGLGSGSIIGTEQEMVNIISTAINNGVNYFDMAPSEQAPFYAYAKAFAGRREKIMTQMHFGAIYNGGKYGWTRNLEEIQYQFEWELKLLHTDYTDMGFIHCVDDEEDLAGIMAGGLWEYMKHLKEEGKIRHLGFSSHNPYTARRLIDTGLVDMFMFSINPSYDYQKGDYAIGEAADRAELYRDCEDRGIGISVMKPFAGGQLLSSKTSVFKKALSLAQCFKYALDQPAVMTVLPGVRNMDDLNTALEYVSAASEEKDYTIIKELTPQETKGICVYCNHCQPCPKGLNVGLINKYYDLALSGDEMAIGHYRKLPIQADACVRCGHCEARCPFQVRQEDRMERIAAYFRKEG